MKENLIATLVHDNGQQRFYKFDKPITKGFHIGSSSSKDIIKELEECKKYLKPDFWRRDE